MNKNEIDVPFIKLDFDDCYDTKLNKSKFNKGIAEGSYWAGIVSCLFTSGLEQEQVKEIVCKLIDDQKSKKESDVENQ